MRTDITRLFGIRVPPEGSVDAEVAFVGERPGKDEARQGRPFVGAAGVILNTFLVKAGIRRDRCWVTNLVKTYEDRDPEPQEIDRDIKTLWDELDQLPALRVIATLGGFSTRALLGKQAAMDLVHGIPHNVALTESGLLHEVPNIFRIFAPREIVVVPVYHPASGLYATEDLALTYWDLCQLKKEIDGEFTSVHEDVLPRPRYERAWGRKMTAPWWYVDTEGSVKKPWGGSLTSQAGMARVFPASRPPRIRPSARVVFHNAPHDLLVLKAMGVEVADDQFDDTMLKAYNLGGVHPQGLKALAYRLAGMEMESYEEVTHEASQRIAVDWLEGLLQGEDRKPERGHSLFKRVIGILSSKDADYRARWKKVVEDRPEWKDIGHPPVATLDDIDPEKAVHYSGRDADATCRIDPVLDKLMEEAGTTDCYRLDLSVVPAVTRMREVGIRINRGKLQALAEELQGKMKAIEADLGFSPNSGDKTALYLFEGLGLPKGRLTKSRKREATDDRILEGLRHLHPDVGKFCDYREYNKLRTNFCLALLELADDHDRVHGDLAIRAKTGRFTMKEPNLLATPAHTDYGARIRDAIEAEDGHVIGDWDLSGIEMRVMADESGDENMIRLFNEGGDLHANTAQGIFGLPAEQQDDHKHRLPAKRVGFGTIMGITGMGLLEQLNLAGANRDGHWTEALCNDMLDKFKNRIYPGVGRYQQQCQAETRRWGFTRDRWGRITYLPGIWAPIERIRSEAERQSCALRIQGGAAGIIKRVIRELWEHFKRWRAEGWWAEMLLPVHDEILFEIDEDEGLKEEVAAVVEGVMSSVVSLRVPVFGEGGWGGSWKEAKG